MKGVMINIIIIALVVMPYTYSYFPSLNTNYEEKQEMVNLTASLKRFENGKNFVYREIINNTNEIIEKEKSSLDYLIPVFESAKGNFMAPFENIRKNVEGEWTVIPESKYKTVGNLIYWSFNFKFIGSNLNALKALVHIEHSSQFIKIDEYRIVGNNDLVTLTGKLDLVYQVKSPK